MIKVIYISLLVLFAVAPTAWARQDHDEKPYEGEEHHDESMVELTKEQLAQLNFETVQVQRGSLSGTFDLQAEVRFLPQNIVHLTPRVPGIVEKVNVTQGDRVKKGQILAVMESRDLGMAKSEFLAAVAREDLYRKTYTREKKLFERKITPEQDYIEAESQFEEGRIDTLVKRQALKVLGLSDVEITELSNGDVDSLTSYTFKAPFDGVVTDLHITKGEFISDQSTAFVIVDPSEVWVVGQVYEKDLYRMDVGLKVTVGFDAYPGRILEGTIEYVSSVLQNETRSAETRIVVSNRDLTLKKGMFARLTVFTEERPSVEGSLIVPNSAVQRKGKQHVLFKVVEEGKFEMIDVQVLRQSKSYSEVKAKDLGHHDKIATGDLFILKSEINKGELGQGHGH